MAAWTEEYLKMIDDCEQRKSRLSEWDCNFLDSIKNILEQEKPLSPKQTETLDRIWERATAQG